MNIISSNCKYAFIHDEKIEDFRGLLLRKSEKNKEQASFFKNTFVQLSEIDYNKYVKKPWSFKDFLPNLIEKAIFYTSKSIYYKFYEDRALEILTEVVVDYSKLRFEAGTGVQLTYIKNKIAKFKAEFKQLNAADFQKIDNLTDDIQNRVIEKVGRDYLISDSDLQLYFTRALLEIYKEQADDFPSSIKALIEQQTLGLDLTFDDLIRHSVKLNDQMEYLTKMQQSVASLFEKNLEDELIEKVKDTLINIPDLEEYHLENIKNGFVRKHFHKTVQDCLYQSLEANRINKDVAETLKLYMQKIGKEHQYNLSKQDIQKFFLKEESQYIKKSYKLEEKQLSIQKKSLEKLFTKTKQTYDKLEKEAPNQLAQYLNNFEEIKNILNHLKISRLERLAIYTGLSSSSQSLLEIEEKKLTSVGLSVEALKSQIESKLEIIEALVKELETNYPQLRLVDLNKKIAAKKNLFKSHISRFEQAQERLEKMQKKIDEYESALDANKLNTDQISKLIEDLSSDCEAISPFVAVIKTAPVKCRKTNEPIQNNPFLSENAFFNSVLSQNKHYLELIKPCIQILSFLCTSTYSNAAVLQEEWEKKLIHLAHAWKAAKDERISLNPELLEKNEVYDAYEIFDKVYETCEKISKEEIKLDPFIKEIVKFPTLTELKINYASLEKIKKSQSLDEIKDFTIFFEGGSSLLKWPQWAQKFVVLASVLCDFGLNQLASPYQAKEVVKTINDILDLLDNKYCRGLIAVLNSMDIVFNGVLATLRTTLSVGMSAFRKMNNKPTDETRGNQQKFDAESQEFLIEGFLKFVDGVLEKQYAGEINLRKIIGVIPQINALAKSAKNLAELVLESYKVDETDEIEFASIDKPLESEQILKAKEQVKIEFEKLILNIINVVQSLAVSFTKIPTFKNLFIAFDETLENIKQEKAPNANEDPMFDWVRHRVIKPFNTTLRKK